MKVNPWVLTTISMVGSCFFGFKAWETKSENYRINLVNSILSMERNVLKDEISNLENNPTYEEGFQDAIIRIGGPQNPGSYQDGWDAAIKVVGNNGYAEGYHAAIQQFGYQKMGETKRWMLPEPEKVEVSPEKK